MLQSTVTPLLLVGLLAAAVPDRPAPPEERVVPTAAGSASMAVESEFLVRWESRRSEPVVPGMEMIRRIDDAWVLVAAAGRGDPPADAARRLGAALGVPVVPNRVLRLAAEPLFDVQWGLENTGALPDPGQGTGTVDADIDAASAWTITTGEPYVVVAVLDSGLVASHAEFDDQRWVNEDEVGGNGLDDDGNGFVDDTVGWDFVGSDNDPTDLIDGHGSAVAGILAADHDGFGIAGLAPGVRVMTVRVCGTALGLCTEADVAAGVHYALDNGASVINMSLGGAFDDPGGGGALGDAIAAAASSGAVVVAAAGNDAIDVDTIDVFPAGFSSVIGVAASEFTDATWPASNVGRATLDVAAPGDEIIAPGLGPASPFFIWEGTSFAAPLVAGTAALMLSANPCLDAAGVRSLITATADAKPGLATTTASGGRLNAASAVAAAEAAVVPGFEVRGPSATAGSDVTFVSCDGSANWTFGDGEAASGRLVIHRYDGVGIYLASGTSAFGTTSVEIVVGLPFVDVSGSIFRADITWLSARRITLGCNPPVNDRFCPRDSVTRGEMAAFLVRALGLVDDGGGDLFVDDDGSVFEGDIDRLGAAGITLGCNPPVNDRFCPRDAVTRGEMAALLHRADI